MENNGKKHSVPCPLCGWMKFPENLVCSNCHKRYIEESAKAVMNGEVALTKEDWVATRIQEKLLLLEAAVSLAKEKLDDLKKLQAEEKDKIFEKTVGSQHLDPEVKAVIRREISKEHDREIWSKLRGGKAIYDFRTAEARLKEAKRLLAELEQKKACPKEAPASPVLEQVKELVNGSKPKKTKK